MLIGFFICDRTTWTTQRYAVSMAPKNWELAEFSESRKLSIFGFRISPKLKKLEGFFLGREYRELAIKNSEQSMKR